ncbi:MAG: hypothetical protein U5K76_10375 [Woeseiaceae bacterium]|nr:hypothetical protein [Woeseiaceae bacterium]
MNSKLGTVVSTVLILAGVLLVRHPRCPDQAGPTAADEATAARTESVSAAADANRDAARAAASRRANAPTDLDIEMIGRTSVVVADN